MKRTAIAALAAAALGCASPDHVQPFPLDTTYTERQADPGKVDEVCYGDGTGHLDSGALKSWNDSYCGCVDFSTRTVWLARNMRCDWTRTRQHEACHIATGTSAAARAMCAQEFHQ